MTSFRFTETFMAIALFFSTAAGNPYDKCVYTIYVKTGSIIKAGTDSKISMTLGDFSGRSVWVPDLRSWGLMGPHYDYFEHGNLDVFSVRGPCMDAPVCRLTLTSNGFGAHAGWYCDHVEVTATGPNTACSKSIFYVQQWLSNDVAPYQMTATRDACNPWNVNAGADQRGKDGKFVVEYPKRYA
ncbi:PLAT domain-containing protein 3-like [Pyrus communis]|uniref:PLAT domain-containing protein 3-like n=1 Tax=Pyrus communis TaxID=23211 RepID=UPI0035BFDABC